MKAKPSRKNYLFFALVCATLVLADSLPSNAAEGLHYAGLEYLGSSQMTRNEIEKSIHLRPGASEKSVETSVANFQKKLEKLRLSANVQIIVEPPDNLFVVVDFEDPLGAGVPVRVLKNPHHVITKSEKPEILLEKLRERINRLNEEGRPWTESYPGGVRMFSDEPASQIVTEIRRFGTTMRDDWLEVVESDPDKRLRCDAIELLNWAPDTVDTCARLIPALDDSHYEVRASAGQFIYPRLDLFPADFPFDKLAAALARQLKRPSHGDRIKAMRFILALVKRFPMMAVPYRRNCEKDLERLSQESQITIVRKSADELLVVLRAPLPKAPPVKIPASGF